MVGILNYAGLGFITLAHLVGLIMAILLLVKIKGTPAILATVAFALLFLLDIGNILRSTFPFLDKLIVNQVNMSSIGAVMGSFNCCCSIFSLAATICLIIAIWQAVSGNAEEGSE